MSKKDILYPGINFNPDVRIKKAITNNNIIRILPSDEDEREDATITWILLSFIGDVIVILGYEFGSHTILIIGGVIGVITISIMTLIQKVDGWAKKFAWVFFSMVLSSRLLH